MEASSLNYGQSNTARLESKSLQFQGFGDAATGSSRNANPDSDDNKTDDDDDKDDDDSTTSDKPLDAARNDTMIDDSQDVQNDTSTDSDDTPKIRRKRQASTGAVYCLDFWYHMYGANMGTLTVYRNSIFTTPQDTNLWTKSGYFNTESFSV